MINYLSIVSSVKIIVLIVLRYFEFSHAELVIGVTGRVLIVCTILSMIAFCKIMYLSRKQNRKHNVSAPEQQEKEEKEDTQTATSTTTPFYDVPVSTEYWEANNTIGVHDQDDKEDSQAAAAIPLYDVPVFTDYWGVNNTVSQNVMSPKEVFVKQNAAYMQ